MTVDELLNVVAQLAAAGSDHAASLQVYLASIWACGADHEQLPASRARCHAAAQRGDPYAMYVVAIMFRTHWFWLRNPLSEWIFVTPFKRKQPLFKTMEK